MGISVDDYRHQTGRHCGSTSLRNLSTHYGWGYDEERCFGLAAGLGFTYFELPDAPYRGFVGRPPRIEETFFETLGIGVAQYEGAEWGTVRERIRERVAADDPVMVFTDIYHLDYFETDTHFAPHSLLCVGVEDNGATVVLSDSEFEDLQRLPFDRLRDAMASEYVVPLRNRHLVVTDPEPTRSTGDATLDAIAEMAQTMLGRSQHGGPDSDFGVQGLAGVRRLADELPAWTDFENPRWSVRFAYQNVERRGTGGGAFRQLYADFLTEIGDSVSMVPADAPSRMNSIAGDWTVVGHSLAEASEHSDPERMRPMLSEIAESIRELANREERLHEDLLTAIG